MDTSTQKITVRWGKIDADNIFIRKIRNGIFTVITKYMADKNGLKVSDFPKDENQYSIVIFEGTKEQCDAEMERLNKVDVRMVNDALNGIKNSTFFKVAVPRGIKAKFSKVKYNPDLTVWEQFNMKLLLVNLFVFIEQNDI
jgi:hypothetical protein